MVSELLFEGKKYISAKDAASISGYTKDYVGQLSRAGKIDSRRVGRVWYVSEEAILRHSGLSSETKTTGTANGSTVVENVVENRNAINSEISFGRDKNTPNTKHISDEPGIFITKTISQNTRGVGFFSGGNSYFSKVSLKKAILVLLTAGLVGNSVSLLVDSPVSVSTLITNAPHSTYTALEDFTDFYSNKLNEGYLSLGTSIITEATKLAKNPPLYITEKAKSFALNEVTLVDTVTHESKQFASNTHAKVFGLISDIVDGKPFTDITWSEASKFTANTIDSLNSFDESGVFIFEKVNNFFNNVIYKPLASFFTTPPVINTVTNTAVTTKPTITPQPTQVTRVINTTNVIERTIERVSQSDISRAEVDLSLQQLNNKLMSEFSKLSSGGNTVINNVYQQLSQSQRIDQLTNTRITSPTITGGSITNTSVSATTLSANTIGTGTLDVSGVSTLATTTITNLTATDSTLTSATTTNSYITSLVADNASTTNATTTNSFIRNLTATNIIGDYATITSATTTNFFSSLFNATTGIIDTLTSTLATITGLNVTNSTTTNATSTNIYSADATFGNITSPSVNLTNLVFTNATGTNATTTNFFSTTGVFDDLYVNDYQQNNGTFSIISTVATGDIFSVTDSSVTSGTLIHQTLTANAGNGQVSRGQIIDLVDSTTAGGGYSALEINVSGSGVGSGAKTLLTLDPGGNNEVVFDSTGAFRPTTDSSTNTNSIGSASFYWKNGYFDTITANNLSGTVVTGATSNDTWTIGSTEASDDLKAVIFQRNSGSGNATFSWNNGSNDLRFLSVNYPFNATYTVNDSSISTTANLFSGALTNNTTGGTQRLLSLSNTGTGTTENGLYVSNTGTGTTALEIAGTWTNGIVTNNNTINAGSGNITTTGTGNFGNLLLTSSTTLQNFTFVNATGTSATTTNFFSTNASSTNLFSSLASIGGAAFNIISSGNVGVGLTNPTEKLEVNGTLRVGTADDFGLINLGDTASGSGNYTHGIFRGDLGVTTGGGYLNLGAWSGIAFNTSGAFMGSQTTRMVIDGTSGNVGIASTTPGYKLSVTGNGFFDGGTVTASSFIATSTFSTPAFTLTGTAINSLLSTNSSGAIVATSTPTFGNFNATSTTATSTISTGGLAVGTSQFVIQQNSGRVGIGTETPGAKLTVKNTSATATALLLENASGGNTGDYQEILMQYDSSGVYAAGIRQIIRQSATHGGNLAFFTDSVGDVYQERMRIDENGYVGIGSGTPNQRLEVRSGNVAITQANQTFTTGSSAGKYMWYVDDDSASQELEAAGEIDFIGTADWAGADTLANIEFRLKTTADVLPTTKMSITSAGNVGVGTTSPYQKLSVVGNVLADLFIATSTTATSTIAGFLDVNGTGTNATSTFASNLWVKGGLQVGTGSLYLDTNSISASNGGFLLSSIATSTFATNGLTVGTSQFVIQQNSGNVGIGTATPNATSILDLTSTTKGFLPPRMDTTARDAISSPATGLTIYNTTTNSLNTYNGTTWLSGGASLSGLSAATAGNTIANVNYAQVWNWDSLTTETALSLGSSSATTGTVLNLATTGTAADDNQKVLNISSSGANASGSKTTYGVYSTNTKTGSGTNIAGYFSASGGTNNYAAIFENGNVGIGTTAPGSKLHVKNDADSSTHLIVENPNVGTSARAGLIVSNAAGEDTVQGFFGVGGTGYTGVASWQDSLVINAGASISGGLKLRSTVGGIGLYAEGSTSVPDMFINESGLVGIGTATPAAVLDVNGAIYARGTPGNHGASRGSFAYASGLTQMWSWGADASTLGGFDFITRSSDGSLSGAPMRITSAGYVGIGTTTPSGQLHVKTAGTGFSATGGTITTSGAYTIHTFTSSGTFTPNGAKNVEYLVVAGGGGGGAVGGGGAGGFRTGTDFAVTAQAYSITVGAGGTASVGGSAAGNGGDSIFSTITSTGGGGGGDNGGAGANGGSGGGGGSTGAGGSGNTPSTSPSQGNNGGTTAGQGGAGGGGAGAVGSNAINGAGGAGTASSISGSSVTYAGGGGGGNHTNNCAAGPGGAGGAGGGGTGWCTDGTTSGATSGTANTGGGGGGTWYSTAGAGGSGIVIIRYLTTESLDFVVKDIGVGIGMTDPSTALDVTGNIEYTGTITDVSDARLKENITDFTGGLSILRSIGVKNYNMISDPGVLETGFIAQNIQEFFPRAVSVVDPKNGYMGVSYVSFIPVIASAVQELDFSTNLRLVNLEQIIASSTPESGGLSFSNILDEFTNQFETIGAKFAGGIAYFKNIFTDKLTVGTSNKPTGVTLYDPEGNAYCIGLQVGGALVSVSGVCGTAEDVPLPPTSEEEGAPPISSDTTPPVITINGDNPATITVGATYSDMGASVTDTGGEGAVNNNLGLHYNVNGTEVLDIQLDTASTTTHTIIYSSVDGAGNWGYATRTVEIVGPVVESPPEVNP